MDDVIREPDLYRCRDIVRDNGEHLRPGYVPDHLPATDENRLNVHTIRATIPLVVDRMSLQVVKGEDNPFPMPDGYAKDFDNLAQLDYTMESKISDELAISLDDDESIIDAGLNELARKLHDITQQGFIRIPVTRPYEERAPSYPDVPFTIQGDVEVETIDFETETKEKTVGYRRYSVSGVYSR